MTRHVKYGLWMAAVLVLLAQWIVVYNADLHFGVGVDALLSGLGILAAAFIIGWAAELAQLDIPAGLAFILLALLTVLPEYAVDIYLAWQAGKDPAYSHFALANMTGANRLLIGFGWPVIVLVYWWKSRNKEILLKPEHRLEVYILLAATVYSFILPLKKSLSWMDAIVFLGIFAVYVVRAARGTVEEPELEGPPEMIAEWRPLWRRLTTAAFFLLSGYTIYIAAEPFAENLIEGGRHLGVEEFLLVQWLAPLASEAPEFLVAVMFAARLMPQAGFHTMLSSKINQWTLLVGMVPLAFSLSLGRPGALHLDPRQVEEIFLTSAQSLFATLILVNLSFSVWEGLLLLALFLTQFISSSPEVRYGYAIGYIVLAFGSLAWSRLKRQPG